MDWSVIVYIVCWFLVVAILITLRLRNRCKNKSRTESYASRPTANDVELIRFTMPRCDIIEPSRNSVAIGIAWNLILLQNNATIEQDSGELPTAERPAGSSRIALVNETARNLNFRQNNVMMRPNSIELPQYEALVLDDLPTYNEAIASIETNL